MKISSMTPFSIAAPSTGNAKGALRFAQSSNTAVDSNRRFDTFTMTGIERKKDGDRNAKNLDEKTAELVRSLSDMSAEDKTKLAFDSYIDMQKSLHYMKEMIEGQIEYFKDMSDKRAYYSGLLDSECIMGEGGGQYKFSDYAEGEHIDRSKVTAQLDKVQKCIDSLCGNNVKEKSEAEPLPPHVLGYITYDDLYRAAERGFRSASEVFCGVTGVSDSALEMERGEFYFDTEGVTEENYLEKANDLLNAITDRSKKLEDIMSEFSYNQRHQADKLKERLETAEMWQKEKDDSIAEMIARYEEYLYKVNSNGEIKL